MQLMNSKYRSKIMEIFDKAGVEFERWTEITVIKHDVENNGSETCDVYTIIPKYLFIAIIAKMCKDKDGEKPIVNIVSISNLK